MSAPAPSTMVYNWTGLGPVGLKFLGLGQAFMGLFIFQTAHLSKCLVFLF